MQTNAQDGSCDPARRAPAAKSLSFGIVMG